MLNAGRRTAGNELAGPCSTRQPDSRKAEKRMQRDPCRVDQKLFDSEGTYGEFGVIATLAIGTD